MDKLKRVPAVLRAGIVLLCVAALVGCQEEISPSRDVVGAKGKQITVMDNPEAVAYKETTVDAIVRIDDANGMDWLSEDSIIVDRENPDFPPEEAEGLSWYPRNLYVHDIATGNQEPISPENENQGNALLSPDRLKLFYKTYGLQSNTGKGHLMDLATRSSFAFTGEDEMMVWNGVWIDNDGVVFSTMDGTIRLASAGSALSKTLLETGVPFAGEYLAYMNGVLYYTTLNGELYSGKPGGAFAPLPVDNVVWMAPSPDEQKLAVVKRTDSGSMELLITDLQGKTEASIAQDAQIFGSAWSPDGARIAYESITPNGTVRGIYVADTVGGTKEELAVDAKFSFTPLRWSPAGTRIMVTTTQPDEDEPRNRLITFLVKVT